MRLPSGNPLARNIPVEGGRLGDLLSHVNPSFNGYIAVTGMGYDGMEEGILLVDNGLVTHSYYVHLKYLYEEKGDQSLKKVANVFMSRGANADVVEFTVPKLKLTASFNEDCALSKPFPATRLPSIIPKSYEKSHVLNIIKLRPIEELNRIKALIGMGLSFGKKEDLG